MSDREGEETEQNVVPEVDGKEPSMLTWSSGFSIDDVVEEEESGDEEDEAKGIAANKESEDSVLKREVDSPMDLKNIKWAEVELLFLKTEHDKPFRYAPTFRLQQSYDAGIVNLDFSFIHGDISKREYDYFTEKYNLFVKVYEDKTRSLNGLIDDNAIFKATLEDHRKIEEWFESMPETSDGKSQGAKDKLECHDIRKERLNAIAYRLVLSDLSAKGDQWTKEVQRMTDDRDFLIEEISRFSPDKGAMTGPKQAVANLVLDVYTLEEELAEVLGKIKAVDDFTHGFVARNDVLEAKLNNLEMRYGADLKEATDLRLETDRLTKTRNELKAKAGETEKNLQEVEEHKQTFVRQFQKLQYESSKWNRKSKLLSRQVDATNMDKQLWELRVLRLKERMEKTLAKKAEMNKEIENVKKEYKAVEKEILRGRGTLEKLENKARLLEKAIAAIEAENEDGRNKITCLKESAKDKGDQSAVLNERRKIEKDIENLRREIIASSRLQGLVRQEYIKVYNELKGLQQAQWSLRKVYQDNTGKIRKANFEQMHQLDNIQRLQLEIEKQKNNIKWVKQQKAADEKLLAKKEAELEKVLLEYRNERLEKSKDLQEQTMRQQSIGEWKEINRVGDSEKEELTALKVQLMAKAGDLRKSREAVVDSIRQCKDSLKETNAELGKSKIEYEAREKAIQKIKFELYKKQLENEGVIHRYAESATERNFKAMKLNDVLREQVCYSEHISTTEEMLRRADDELLTRIDAVTRLESIKKMETLGMDKMREKLESWQGTIDTLDELTRRFEEVTARQIELQKRFKGTRYRMVREKQKEDPREVQRKLSQLEDRVLSKEEKLIELRLLNNQTNKLLEDLQRSRDERLEMAQVSNNAFVDTMRKNIDAEKRTKRMAVELSLKKALVDSLKKELEDAKEKYKEATERFRRGEPPTAEIEAEWVRSTKKLNDFREVGRKPRGAVLKTDNVLQVTALC